MRAPSNMVTISASARHSRHRRISRRASSPFSPRAHDRASYPPETPANRRCGRRGWSPRGRGGFEFGFRREGEGDSGLSEFSHSNLSGRSLAKYELHRKTYRSDHIDIPSTQYRSSKDLGRITKARKPVTKWILI